jgi:hypothetical protein
MALALFLATRCQAAEPYQVMPTPAPRLAARTVVGLPSSEPWSHVIIQSKSRLDDAERGKVNSLVARLATLLFTAILADVDGPTATAPETGYRIVQVGVGLGTEIGGQDVIVTSDTHRAQQANLGVIGSVVLGQAESRLDRIVQVVSSPYLVVIDAPAILQRGTQHVDTLLRYALVLDPKTGRLDTLLWLLEVDKEGRAQTAAPRAQWLSPSMVEDCRLHVDENEFLAGVPTNRAFAVLREPQGTSLACSPRLQELAGRAQFTTAEAAEFDRLVRELIGQSWVRGLRPPQMAGQ